MFVVRRDSEPSVSTVTRPIKQDRSGLDLPWSCSFIWKHMSGVQAQDKIEEHLIRALACTRCSFKSGAGSGNRTRIFSLEGCCSTTELYPHTLPRCAPWTHKGRSNTLLAHNPCQNQSGFWHHALGARFRQWWRRLDSNQRKPS